MLTIDCHHPEIRTFINIKRDLAKVTGANISIRWSDEFLEAVEARGKVQLRFPVERNATHRVSEMVDAKEIWEEFIDAAHSSAEPGCLFWDTAIAHTPADIYSEEGFGSKSTNPCGEVILSSDDSCRLIATNTVTYVVKPFTDDAYFDFEAFKRDTIKAQRLMDDLVDLEIEQIDKILAKIESDPEPAHIKEIELQLWNGIRKAAVNGRRTGLGVTAIGDTLAALGLCYGSKASVNMVGEIYKALALGAYQSSVMMAGERGPFPIFSHKKEEGHEFLNRIWSADPSLYNMYLKNGRRNIALTTTAPTGSVSTMTQTTSGIEPVFMTHYKRRKKINPNDKGSRIDFIDQMGDKWQEYTVYHHGVENWMSISGEDDISKSPYYGATANEIDWGAAVDLQAAAQRWVCHAISKTTNLPNSATKEDVHNVYWRGWKSGCKGITVYRDGCRSGVLVAADAPSKKTPDGRPDEIQPSHAPKRPNELPCEIHHVTVKGVKWVILVGLMAGRPYEMFAGSAENLTLPSKLKSGLIHKVKHGVYSLHVPDADGSDPLVIKNIVHTFDNPESAWATRMISMSLRHGIDVPFIVEQLSKDGNITDINKVLSRVLKKYIADGAASNIKCRDCGSSNVAYAEGCLTCKDCGSSKC
jgi:ribonucleoside-diphosphate reductase alpha chain